MIKAIETIYKGYRFRSRLEARWAVAFDTDGIKWEYEPEGLNISGTNYLPDFYLPKYNLFIEVKPDNYSITGGVKKIYFAGKMGEPQDNKIPGTCWRPFDILDSEDACSLYSDSEYPSSKLTPITCSGKTFVYTGPYKGIGDYHGYVHGITTCGFSDITDQKIMTRSVDGIDKAEIVFVMLNDLSAYGTIAEIGYAYAKRKNIIVGVTHNLLCPDYADIGDVCSATFDAWFPVQMASHVITGDTEEEIIGKFFTNHVTSNPTKELVAMSEMDGLYVVCGDPFEHNLITKSSLNGKMCFRLSKEAKIAGRQARFEHGDRRAA